MTGPYVILKIGEHKLAQTESQRYNGEPHWNASFLVRLTDVENNDLNFEIWNHHMLSGDEKIGIARLCNLVKLEKQIVKGSLTCILLIYVSS